VAAAGVASLVASPAALLFAWGSPALLNLSERAWRFFASSGSTTPAGTGVPNFFARFNNLSGSLTEVGKPNFFALFASFSGSSPAPLLFRFRFPSVANDEAVSTPNRDERALRFSSSDILTSVPNFAARCCLAEKKSCFGLDNDTTLGASSPAFGGSAEFPGASFLVSGAVATAGAEVLAGVLAGLGAGVLVGLGAGVLAAALVAVAALGAVVDEAARGSFTAALVAVVVGAGEDAGAEDFSILSSNSGFLPVLSKPFSVK